MPKKAWTFVLDGEEHLVELEYSLVSTREKLRVDGQTISDEDRLQLISRYDFSLGSHKCVVTLYALPPIATIAVRDCPAEVLPCNALLRPVTDGPNTLLRPVGSRQVSSDDLLLRPDDAPV